METRRGSMSPSQSRREKGKSSSPKKGERKKDATGGVASVEADPMLTTKKKGGKTEQPRDMIDREAASLVWEKREKDRDRERSDKGVGGERDTLSNKKSGKDVKEHANSEGDSNVRKKEREDRPLSSSEEIDRLMQEQLRIGEEDIMKEKERKELERMVKEQLRRGEEEEKNDKERIQRKKRGGKGLAGSNGGKHKDPPEEWETVVQVNTVWIDETKVGQCPLCSSTFNLIKRKVHSLTIYPPLLHTHTSFLVHFYHTMRLIPLWYSITPSLSYQCSITAECVEVCCTFSCSSLTHTRRGILLLLHSHAVEGIGKGDRGDRISSRV